MLYLFFVVFVVAAVWWLRSDWHTIRLADAAMKLLETYETALDPVLEQMEALEAKLNRIACRGWSKQVQEDAHKHLVNINQLREAQAVEYYFHAGLP